MQKQSTTDFTDGHGSMSCVEIELALNPSVQRVVAATRPHRVLLPIKSGLICVTMGGALLDRISIVATLIGGTSLLIAAALIVTFSQRTRARIGSNVTMQREPQSSQVSS
ncbi:MAG: hypothetical protein ABIS34_01080 [Opitutus sp.]